jgi:hypothetical protein
MSDEESRKERKSEQPVDDRITLEDLEPGDRKEEFSPIDWCLAAGCGCGGCLDPTGCLNALSQGCLGCLEACLGRIGCGVLVIGAIVWLMIVFIT